MPTTGKGGLADWEARLRGDPALASFTGADLTGLPEPVRRHPSTAIAPGTPLTRCAHLAMRGSIKLGRWLPLPRTTGPQPARGGAVLSLVYPPASVLRAVETFM